jgi:hypothetical protein
MSLADLDMFDNPGAATARPSGSLPRRPPAVIDLSRIDTAPGAEGPFAPPCDMQDRKEYARLLRTLSRGQRFRMVALWICAPRPHTPRVVVTGPFSDVFHTCVKRFYAELQR